MWLPAVWIGVSGLLWCAQPAWAGPTLRVCDKTRKADVVVELRFAVKGRYPPLYLKRRWCPQLNRRTLASAKVIRVSYDLMEIQSFFTVGEDECRAWSIKVGTKAPEAAGTIHTDLQKGFIRAEVMSVELLIELGSEAAVKKAGKMHLEGKDYVVQEGDVVHVRFNV